MHVREAYDAKYDRALLEPCVDGDASGTIAQSSGLAWKPADLPLRNRGRVAYYHFHQWLSYQTSAEALRASPKSSV